MSIQIKPEDVAGSHGGVGVGVGCAVGGGGQGGGGLGGGGGGVVDEAGLLTDLLLPTQTAPSTSTTQANQPNSPRSVPQQDSDVPDATTAPGDGQGIQIDKHHSLFFTKCTDTDNLNI